MVVAKILHENLNMRLTGAKLMLWMVGRHGEKYHCMAVFIDTYTSPCVANDQYAMPQKAMLTPTMLDNITAKPPASACCLALRFLNSYADCAVPSDAMMMLRKA